MGTETKWTPEQQNVIDFRDRNILVSAAAGSGKTAVLVERIIQRITDSKKPLDIDRLLVVTFTKAAAAEMRERIGNAIEKCLEENPEDENLRKQSTLIHNAQITTIDSFCLFVVRNYFEEIHLDPNFRIADQGEIKLLEMDVLNDLFEQEYEKADETFLNLVDAYSDKRSNKAVKDMVSKIYRQSSSSPWPKEWITALAAPYQVTSKEELLATPMMQGIFTYVKTMLIEMQERLISLRKLAVETEGLQKYVDMLDKDIELFSGITAVENYLDLETICRKIEFARAATITKFEGDENKKEAVSKGRSAVREEFKEIKERYFAMPLEQLVDQLRRMRGHANELVRLALLYVEAMDAKKEEKHIMDFSDIEHAALRIFVDEDTKELRGAALDFKKQFDEIMIDEYQDSNQVQEEIMCAISGESEGRFNMFMVGDVKQSIYRFRLARPELFMEKFATYDLNASSKQRIDLHKNFRSRNEVLEFTNDIFYKIMDADLGNVLYDEAAALYCGAEYVPAEDMAAEVLLYEKAYEAEGVYGEDGYGGYRAGAETDSLSTRQLEARMIASRIQDLKETLQVTDKETKKLRPLRNSDIVILLRSIQGWGNDFVSVLGDCGIPAHVATSTGYFSAVEVQTVLSFLKILDNPYQDIPMAAVLKSAIVGLDNEELAEISMTEGTNSFAEAALKQMSEAEEGKLYHFNQLYQKLRKRVVDTSIHLLIEMVLEETGYGDYVKALPAGGQRKANLDMLVEKAVCYEKTSYKGLFHFVRYIDQLQKYEVDFGEADVTGENEDVVRIMTIHKSKGLEFPVVFVSGMGKQFNEMDSREKLTVHPDMGLGLDEIQKEPRTKRKCMIRTEIADRIRRDNLGEELRVLYVALTRAKEKLILTGVIKSQEQLYEKYTGLVGEKVSLPFGVRNKARTYLDWVAPAILSYPDKYEFTFVNADDLILSETRSQAEKTLSKEAMFAKIATASQEMVEQFQKGFAFQYPYQQEAGRKSKYSVSELKHASMVENYDRMEGEVEVPQFLLEERESYVPEFAREQVLAADKDVSDVNPGALRGTAFHRVMECLDFVKLLDYDTSNPKALWKYLCEEIARMLEKKLLTEEMEQLIYKNSIIDFLQSPVALRMAQAAAKGNLYVEKPFVMDYEGVLVQGIIDVFWLEDDKIVLMDYKTDSVSKPEELLTRYATQLQLYGQALGSVFGRKGEKKETENLIYSFTLGEVISV